LVFDSNPPVKRLPFIEFAQQTVTKKPSGISGRRRIITQMLTDQERAILLEFLGFGNPRAPIVFIGMEEGLTETPHYPLLAQLKDRARLSAVADLRDSSVHPDKYLVGPRPPIQRTWGILIRVLLALNGKPDPNTDDVRFYQRDELGSLIGQSLLLELLPLPARSVEFWAPYDRYFPEFPTRDEYRRTMMQRRVDYIAKHLSYGPTLVLAYGVGYWNEYKSLFPLVESWTREGVFAYGRYGATAVVLTPHPVARQMNGQQGTLCALVRRVAHRSISINL
jgi:hypothetical protein